MLGCISRRAVEHGSTLQRETAAERGLGSESARRARRYNWIRGLDLAVLVERMQRFVPAVAGLLVATERGGHVTTVPAVHPDAAGAQLACDTMGAAGHASTGPPPIHSGCHWPRAPLRPRRRNQARPALARTLPRVPTRGPDAPGRTPWAARSSRRTPPRPDGPHQQTSALAFGTGDIGQHLVHVRGVDQRTHRCIGLQWMAGLHVLAIGNHGARSPHGSSAAPAAASRRCRLRPVEEDALRHGLGRCVRSGASANTSGGSCHRIPARPA